MRLVLFIICALALAAGACGWCTSIAQVKSVGSWIQVTVDGIVTYTEPTDCYIESADRSGGIWVQGSTEGIHIGDAVTATGTFAVVDGEPCVTEAILSTKGATGAIRPFGMRNAAVGGASKWSPASIQDFRGSWAPASGASNAGLLVTTWGTVRSVNYSPVNGASWMYVDDGSGVVSDEGNTGILVYSDAQPSIGDFVSVTGVSSTEPSLDDPARPVRVIRGRSASDVSVLRARRLHAIPFSDEFDGPKLDPRWGVRLSDSVISLDTMPGSLTFTTSPQRYTGNPQTFIAQYVEGDFDIEMKMRAQFTTARPGMVQMVALYAGDGVWPVLFGLYRDPYDGDCAYVACASLTRVPGNTAYFRVSRRGNTISGQVSFDGANYSETYSYTARACWTPFVCLSASFAYSGTVDQPFQAYFDYFRITPVPAQGGQQ